VLPCVGRPKILQHNGCLEVSVVSSRVVDVAAIFKAWEESMWQLLCRHIVVV
jgi:hypothetical protein